MAKFRRMKKRSYSNIARRRSNSVGENTTSLLLSGGAYGIIRGYAHNLISPFTSSFGQYGTPAVLGVVGYLMAKKAAV